MFFCSLLCIFKMVSNICFSVFEYRCSKTECKYTKTFFSGKYFNKNIFNSFYYICNHKFTLIMFNKNIKLILAGLLVVAGVWQFTESNIGNGIFPCFYLTAIPIFLYFKNEFILLAFLKLRKQDFRRS